MRSGKEKNINSILDNSQTSCSEDHISQNSGWILIRITPFESTLRVQSTSLFLLKSDQNFENHAKVVPAYHYLTFPMLALPTLYLGYGVVTDFSFADLVSTLPLLVSFIFSVGVVFLFFFARVFALGVQDRVIRLEERMRMEKLLPEDLKHRIPEVTTEQMIALRFASDEELTGLVFTALSEGISDRKTLKQAIKNWRADNQRI